MMTSSSRTNGAHAFRRGFTLVEMLVVIGIIVALMAILLPMTLRAYKTAIRTRMAADLQAITGALEAYKADFNDYPRLGPKVGTNPVATSGAALLCWALIAPGPAAQDGYDGAGFIDRVSGVDPQGKSIGHVHPAYLSMDQFKINDSANPTAIANDRSCTINDRYGHPILYFAATPGADAKVSYISDFTGNPTPSKPAPLYNYHDNNNFGLTLFDMQAIMGDVGPITAVIKPTPNGKIDGSETPLYQGPFLLWCAGPDEQYGFQANTNYVTDDVTNAP